MTTIKKTRRKSILEGIRKTYQHSGNGCIAMMKYLTTHGNSSALVIEKPILDLLNITRDTPLEVSTDGKSLIVSPVRNPKHESKVREALAKVNARHHKTLQALAK